MQALLNIIYLIIQVWVVKLGALLISTSHQMLTRLEPQFRLIQEFMQKVIFNFRSVSPERLPHKGLRSIPIYVVKENPVGPGSGQRITQANKNSSL